LKKGDIVEINLPDSGGGLPAYSHKVEVVFEDDDIIVVNKPSGLTTHPPQLNYRETLVNALLTAGKQLSDISSLRRGVVHRLDKDTSGVIVLAKNETSHNFLVKQFKTRKIKKEYRAIVWGCLQQDKLRISLPIAKDQRNRLKRKVSFLDSKEAVTDVQRLSAFSDSTYLKINLITGRTHQIRVHLAFADLPIIGDRKYGKKDGFEHLFLHSYKLKLTHPRTKKIMALKASLPGWFTRFIKNRQ
jgi:23S rRNA pseudouridine1911/1915/1917 synthase